MRKCLICLMMLLTAGCSATPTTTPLVPTPIVITPLTPTKQAPPTPLPTSLSASTAQPTQTPAPIPPTATVSTAAISLHKIVDNVEPLTYLTFANDSKTRLYLVAKAGRVLVLDNGVVRAQPFLDISDRVGSDASERGLLSIAFSPNYAADSTLYTYYTNLAGNVVVARFTAARTTAVADPASEQILLTVSKSFPNHNGGQLQFGPDGMLYIGLGDGGSQGDPNGNGQNTQVLLGKLLRIDVSKAGQAYSVPADNPLVTTGGRPEIWAYGLRNPWRFSFDLKTGELYIADVGQDLYEEIDVQPAGDPGGENYGWRLYEGFTPYKGGGDTTGLTMPVYAYNHTLGCSITGGYVYRGARIPALNGAYLYSDYCTGHLWSLQRDANGKWDNTLLTETGENVSSFGEDAAGELYIISLRGAVYQLAP